MPIAETRETVRLRSALILLLTGLAAASFQALAGPLEDDILRRLRAVEERLARIEVQSQSQGLLDLLNQVERLKAEVASLRGAQEEQAHRLAIADKRQKDLYTDLDGRIKELAARPAVAAPAQPAPAQPVAAPVQAEEEAKVYQAAFDLIKVGNYKAAIAAFQNFLKAYSGGALAGNAQYWIGFSHFSLAEFKQAAAAQQKLLQAYPDSPKVPDAMLGLARAQLELGEGAAARATLEQIVAKYPGSKAAEYAKQHLASQK